MRKKTRQKANGGGLPQTGCLEAIGPFEDYFLDDTAWFLPDTVEGFVFYDVGPRPVFGFIVGGCQDVTS